MQSSSNKKIAYPSDYMDSFKRFKENNCPIKNASLVQQKKKDIGED